MCTCDWSAATCANHERKPVPRFVKMMAKDVPPGTSAEWFACWILGHDEYLAELNAGRGLHRFENDFDHDAPQGDFAIVDTRPEEGYR